MKVQHSAKSVQTTRVVSSNFSRSLYRLQLKSPESTTYLQIYVRVLTEVFTCTYHCKCAYLQQRVRRTYLRYLHLNMQGIKAMCPALPSWTHHSIYHLNGLLFYREDTQVVLNTTLHCKGTPTYRGGQYLTICILKSDYTYL